MRETDALRAQLAVYRDLVDPLDPGEMQRPTRCPPWTVRELLSHLGSAFAWSRIITRGEDPPDQPRRTRVSWFTDTDDELYPPSDLVPIAQRDAEGRSDDEIKARTLKVITSGIEAFDAGPADRPAGSSEIGFSILAADLAATRVLELTTHTMDIGHAVAKGEPTADQALALSVELLDAILGEPLPIALGWSEKAYLLTATGRRPLSSTERTALGPLSDRFPLLH